MNTDKKWFSLRIKTDARASEAIEFALNELDALGTEIDNLGKNPLPEKLEIVGYFNEKPDADLLKDQLNEALRIYDFDETAIEACDWQEVENRDWLAEWKKDWKPTKTAKFIIAPMWETIESDEKIVIRIEPSMAFGTGTHETTRLCLQAIEENYRGESFLDVGTGTGILAMAAAKVKSGVLSLESGAGKDSSFRLKTQDSSLQTPILACDTDEDSIKIAVENSEINGTDEIEFYVGSITGETPKFDWVCANLTADVIIPILPLLVEKSNKTLVLSGILKEQEELVVSELRKFEIEDEEIRTDGEWISVTVERGQRIIEN